MAITQANDDRHLFRAYWDDGLVDLLFGGALLVTGIGWASDLGALAVVQAPLWVVLWAPLRKRFVEPRAGYVEFSMARRQRNTHALRWTVALGVGTLVLFALVALLIPRPVEGELPRRLVVGLPAMLVAIGVALAGVLMGAVRFGTYALGLALAAAFTVMLSLAPDIPLVAGGLAVTGWGATLFARFMRSSREYEERP